MADPKDFKAVVTRHDDPFIGGVAIDVSVSDQLLTQGQARAVYASANGNLACVMADGSALTFTGLLAGNVYLLALRSVTKTGTTVTGNILF